jgi:pimeloyl-ACP methyl ester carboxylesterase
MWQRVVESLSRSFHIIIIDLPGFGDSDCPIMPFSTRQYADIVSNVMNELKIDRAAIAGISYGGQIAATFAHSYSDRVEKLALIASTGLHEHRWFAKNDFAWKIFSLIGKHVLLKSFMLTNFASRKSFYDMKNRPPDLVKNFHRKILQLGRREAWLNGLRNVYFSEESFKKNLRELNIPTLIIWGEMDRSLPRKFADEFHSLIKNSTLKIFPRCSHSVPLEKPEEMAQEFYNFGFH